MPPSDDIIAFILSMDEPGTEAYDLDALGRLEGDELFAAKYALGKNLDERVDDARTPDAIRIAGFADLVPKLRDAVDKYPHNHTRVAAAEALWDLAEDPKAVDTLVAIYAESRDPQIQLWALEAASRIQGDGVDQRLADQMVEGSRVIRKAAETTLWDRNHVGSVMNHPPGELADAAHRLKSKDPEARRQAVQDFHAAAKKLGPTIRGIPYPDIRTMIPAGASEDLLAFFHSMMDASSRAAMERYDTAALARLKGDELALAKRALAENLESRLEDPRTPDAIREMEFTDLLPQLRDAVTYYSNNYTRAAAAEALWELDRDPTALDALAEVSAKGSEPEIRILATDALSRLVGEASDELLAEVMYSDADKIVRVAAESMLWDRNGVGDLKGRAPAELADAARRLKSKRADVRRQAVEDFQAAAKQVRADRGA